LTAVKRGGREALKLATPREIEARLGGVTAVKTILAKIDGSSNDAAVLELSYLVAVQFRSHITCLHVRADSLRLLLSAADGIGLAAGAIPVSPQVQQTLLEAETVRARSARQCFEAFCQEHHLQVAESPSTLPEASASWREVVGDPRDATTTTARFYDMLVLARAQTSGDLYVDDIGSVLMDCGRPVLLAVSPPPKTIATTIAIAWKETAEAARALAAASPLLAGAKQIVVLTLQEDRAVDSPIERSAQALANQLHWRGLQASARTIPHGGQTPAQSIVAAAREAGADLLVMGAYGHSRARELVFGGMTRHILTNAGIPVLLFH